MKTLVIIILSLFLSSCTNMLYFINGENINIYSKSKEDFEGKAQTEILKYQSDTIRRE